MLPLQLRKKKPHEKSKKNIRTTSLGKDQAKSRPKLKPDDHHIKKFANKALLSVSMETEDRASNLQHYKSIVDNEPKPKKNSPGLKKKCKANHNQSAIFKTDIVRRRETHSALQPKKSSKEKITRGKKTRLVAETKYGRCTNMGLSLYPRIPEEMMSMTSSEVFFSSYGQSRDEVETRLPAIRSKKPSLGIQIVNLQQRMKMDVNREGRRKQQAVIKIQKIWRGYQTRKILQPFVTNQLSSLQEKLHIIRSNRQRDCSDRSLHVEVTTKGNFYGTFLDIQLNLEDRRISISNDFSIAASRQEDLSSVEFSRLENDNPLSSEHPRSHPQESPEKQVENAEEEEFDQDESDLDEDISDFHLYRHQRPIYSHQELDDYFKGRGKQSEPQEGEDCQDQPSEYQEDEFQPQIILQTNQQYLESRKNSIQNKNPKLFDHSLRRASVEITYPPNSITEQLQKQVNLDSPLEENHLFQTLEVDDRSTKSVYKQQLERLKEAEYEKWQSMICYVKSSMGQNPSKEMQLVLDELMMRSGTNKECFPKPKKSMQQNQMRVDTQMTTEQSKNSHHQVPAERSIEPKPIQLHSFKKKNLKLDIDSQANQYSINEPLISKSNKVSNMENTRKFNFDDQCSPQGCNKHSGSSRLFELESSLIKNQGFNSEALDVIINLRQDVLQEKERADYIRLNDLLQSKKISLEDFQLSLMKLQRYADDQRIEISKNRKEIEKGLRVAAKIISRAEKDAYSLGKRIGTSRSAESLKIPSRMTNLLLINTVSNQEKQNQKTREKAVLAIGEGKPQRPSRNFFVNEDGSDSDQLDFTQEQYLQLSRPSLSNEFTELSRNIIITQEFLLKGQESTMTGQVPESKQSTTEAHSEYVLQVTTGIVDKLIYQCAIECYKSATILQTLSNKFNINTTRPNKVTRQEINQFIEKICNSLPEKSVLVSRLNQQICPPPLQLLKCMRVDLFPLDENQPSYTQQMDKYQFIIPQGVCIEAISQLLAKRTHVPAATPIDQVQKLQLLDSTLRNHLEKREKFSQLRAKEMVEKSKQVFQSQMHCVFDCWNEQIIIQKSQIAGFSGIGLNQCTLSLKDQNDIVTESEVDDHITRAKVKLLKIVSDQNPGVTFTQKMERMASEEICANEGSWACYTDQALGFILELDFVVFEELMIEMARVLQKKILTLTLSY